MSQSADELQLQELLVTHQDILREVYATFQIAQDTLNKAREALLEQHERKLHAVVQLHGTRERILVNALRDRDAQLEKLFTAPRVNNVETA